MESAAGRSAPLRVVVIDADDRVRESLARLLCISGRIDTVGTAGQADEAAEVVGGTRPDVVLIDPRVPDIDAGLRLIDRLRAVAPDSRIVVMTGAASIDRPDLVAAADRILRKTYRTSDLVAAVTAVAEGSDA